MFYKNIFNARVLIGFTVCYLVSSADRVINGGLEFNCSELLDSRYFTELFERCGFNPEQGRISKKSYKLAYKQVTADG